MSDDRNPGVVVVLNWHGRADTVACVESLQFGNAGTDVLVVDNGSFDGTLEAVSRRWPGIATLQLPRNHGFAGGMNRGLGWALQRDYRYVTILNNDTILQAGTLAELEEAATQGAAVSPLVSYASPREGIWFAGGTLEGGTFPRHLQAGELRLANDVPTPTEVLAGCCVTASSATWRTVGPFDERYFLNFEDSNWSLRARQAGVPLLVLAAAEIEHRVSASFTGAASLLGTFYYARNGLLFNLKAGGDRRSRWQFLRRRVLPTLKARSPGAAVRQALMIAVGVACYIARVFGPAPRVLQRLASARRPLIATRKTTTS